jgi:hypothetical protein
MLDHCKLIKVKEVEEEKKERKLYHNTCALDATPSFYTRKYYHFSLNSIQVHNIYLFIYLSVIVLLRVFINFFFVE